VMVAILIVPIMLFGAFAIDVGHWWVHERHLQTQADAGVLAGALGPWLPTCDEAAIENNARQYASNLGTGYNPQYTNAANVHAVLNSSAFYNNGGSDFSDGGTPCDLLASATEDNPAFLDVKATEENLSNFFGSLPGFSVVPAINAHARVEIQGKSGGDDIRPIAVRDDTAYQCAQATLVDAATGLPALAVPNSITLTRTTGPPTTPYTEFQNTGGTSVAMPTLGSSMYVRIALFANRDPLTGLCTGASDVFPTDDSGNPIGGVNFINVFAAGPPLGPTPVPHSVTITNGGCAPDQYFSFYTDNTSCNVTVVANVEFPAAALTRNPQVDIAGTSATPNATFNVWTASFSIPASSGPHTYDIRARYNGCGNACQNLGVLQQAYSGLNDDGEPSSSGPISMVQIGEGGPGVGANSFQRQTTHNLVVTVRLQGLANSRPTDRPIVLRFPVQGSKRTGVVDCGQGNGAQEAHDAIVNGCPRSVYVWPLGSTCVSPSNSAAPTPIDCVGIVPGNRRQQIARGFADRIGNSCNNWNAYRNSNGTTTFPPGDPRMVDFIITSPVDLSGSGGSNNDVPVLLFATFYVTGSDGLPKGNGNGCENEKYPGTGNGNFAVWGHWIKWTSAGGSGSGKGCIPNQFGACVAVLTQ
jgi:hypothetical protein